MGLHILNRLSGSWLQTWGPVPVQHGGGGEYHNAIAQRHDVNGVARERVQPQLHMKHNLLVHMHYSIFCVNTSCLPDCGL